MVEPLIELGLLRPDRPVGLIDQLLSILSKSALDSDSLKTEEFREQLQICRRKLVAADGTPDFGRHAKECLALCEGFYDQARDYLLKREVEFGEVIQYLREAVAVLAGDSSSLTEKLTQTSERMDRLADIEDIRELKKLISEEVQHLRVLVAERKERDIAGYARLMKRVELLEGWLDETRSEATLDGLTGIANRRMFDRTLTSWLALSQRSGTPFVLAMLDLDNFKAINDSRGHQVGDRVLLCAAQIFSRSVRGSDFVARFGGEEFVILLSGLTLSQAESKFSDILARLASTIFDYDVADTKATISFTSSCGLAECVIGESAEALLKRADEALYRAKRDGKNRVKTASPPKTLSGLWKSLKPLVPFNS